MYQQAKEKVSLLVSFIQIDYGAYASLPYSFTGTDDYEDTGR